MEVQETRQLTDPEPSGEAHPFVRVFTLRDGTQAVVRPMQPEDLPAWRAMLETCSPQTLWLRFECHSLPRLLADAPQWCLPKLGTQWVLVAELLAPPRIIGEGRLCLEPHGECGEFCVMVADPWQRHGLGRFLTDCCLELATALRVRRLVAEVLPENARMIALLQSRGFGLHKDAHGQVLFAERRLDHFG